MRSLTIALAAAVFAVVAPAAAQTVTSGTSEGVTTDVLNGATITATSPILGGFAAQDAFGAKTSNSTYPESMAGGHVIFADGANTNFITFNTAAAVLLSGVNIFTSSDDVGNAARQFATVTLFAGTAANNLVSLGTARLGTGGQTVSYTFAPTTYQFFRFEGTNATNGARLLEIDGVSPVPEPASWALMIAGFGLAGTVVRRARRRALAVA